MLDKIYLGNTLEIWLYALFIAGGAIIVGKLLYWVYPKNIESVHKRYRQ